MASISELRQILKQDQSGKNLYDHLTETVMKILLDRPSNAYDMFELISSEVKVNPLNPEVVSERGVPPSEEEVCIAFVVVLLSMTLCQDRKTIGMGKILFKTAEATG